MGVSFCVAGMKVVNLNAYKVGCIMFVGLFIYDVFWVFGSKVQSEERCVESTHTHTSVVWRKVWRFERRMW